MHYVKHFDILGIDTRQVPCIELQGIPTTATEGAVGVLGVNMLSADHEVYVCVGVQGGVYTWIPVKGDGGVTITDAIVNESNELVLTLSNGKVLMAGTIQGAKGEDAVPTLIPIEVKTTIDSDGIFNGHTAQVEVIGKRYRVVSPRKGSPGSPSLRHAEDATKFHIILPVEIKPYKDYYTIEVFSVSAKYNSDTSKWVHTIIYEVDGVEKSAIEECDAEYSLDSLALLFQGNVREVYECNEDATLIGEKGEKGDKGENGKDGTIITANGEEQATWNADTKADVEEVESVREETNMLWDEVFSIYGDLNHASTRIGKVEQDTKLVKEALFNKGIIARAEIEQAYHSRVTADGQNIVDGQKTPVTMIKGSTVRCENFVGLTINNTLSIDKGSIGEATTEKAVVSGVLGGTPYTDAWSNGRLRILFNNPITFPVGDYSLTFYLKILSTVPDYEGFNMSVYFDSADGSGTYNRNYYKNNNNNKEKIELPVTFSNEKTLKSITISVNSLSVEISELMFNAGTVKPYQPYFTDLKRAKIDSIVSTGRNLLDISKLVGDALVDNGDGTYTFMKNGNSRFSRRWILDTPIKGGYIYTGFELLKSTISGRVAVRCSTKKGRTSTFGIEGVNRDWGVGLDDEIIWIDMYLNNTETDGAYITFKNPYVTRQVEGNGYYTPFIQETYQLPETLELGEWDSFNPQTGEITRVTGRIEFTGDEEWMVEGASYGGRNFYTNPIENAFPRQSVICNYYNSNVGESTAKADNAFITNTKRLNITASNFTTVEEWKAFLQARAEAGNPLIVEYELATPTVEKLEYAPKSYTAYNQGNETAVLENAEFGAIPTITNEYIVVL